MVIPDAEVREAVQLAIYRGLQEYDREKRSARNWRIATRGTYPPPVVRGTGRNALTNHLTDRVLVSLQEIAR